MACPILENGIRLAKATSANGFAGRIGEEETGLKAAGSFIPLKPITEKGGKVVHAWAFEGDCDPAAIKSNTFTIEWPPKSGKKHEFPEMDRAEFLDLATARTKIKAGQDGLIEEPETLKGLNRG